MFANIIIVLAVVFGIAAVAAAPMDLASWMYKENRTFFFVKWWRIRCHKKNVQMILDIRKEVGNN